MLRKSRISAAIAFALASLAAAPSVSAEEGQNVEKLQKIKVTGSRISRVDVEGRLRLSLSARLKLNSLVSRLWPII